MSVCKRCLVDGRVQGVFYRASVYSKAIEIGVTGWVSNLENGQVEVCIQGDQGKVDAMVDWLWQGSLMSDVSSVQCTEEEDCDYNGFSVAH